MGPFELFVRAGTLSCPNGCSGEGSCKTVGGVAASDARGTTSAGVAATAGFTVDYTNFEAAQLWTCVCDYGAYGPDCSLRMCPRGDNPETTHQTDFTFTLTVAPSDSGGALSGALRFWFNGQVVGTTLTAVGTSSSGALCEAAFNSLPNVAVTHCTRVSVNSGTKGAVYAVRLTQFADGLQNNLHMHNGANLLPVLACDVSGAASTVGTVECGMTAFDTTLTASGTYGGSTLTVFTIQVADDGVSPNTYAYSQDGGALSSSVAMSTSAGPVGGLAGTGVQVAWASIVGHTTVSVVSLGAGVQRVVSLGAGVQRGVLGGGGAARLMAHARAHARAGFTMDRHGARFGHAADGDLHVKRAGVRAVLCAGRV